MGDTRRHRAPTAVRPAPLSALSRTCCDLRSTFQQVPPAQHRDTFGKFPRFGPLSAEPVKSKPTCHGFVPAAFERPCMFPRQPEKSPRRELAITNSGFSTHRGLPRCCSRFGVLKPSGAARIVVALSNPRRHPTHTGDVGERSPPCIDLD